MNFFQHPQPNKVYDFQSLHAVLATTAQQLSALNQLPAPGYQALEDPPSYQTLEDPLHDMNTMTTVVEEEVCPFAFVPTVPKLKFHEAPLYFMSESGMTQQEYQSKLLAREISDDEDDTITVKCPDREDGIGQLFQFKRSTLKRSPTLAQFFNSSDYLHGCNIVLTFLLDPAVCVNIAYKYLEQGADVFQQTILRVQLTMRYKLVDRSIILVKLYTLAQKLTLPLLMDMAYGVLTEGDYQMTASDCLTVSSLVFNKWGIFDRKLKEWCICRIKSFVPELKDSSLSSLWHEVMSKSEAELTQRWVQLLVEFTSHLEPVHEASEDLEVSKTLKRSASQQPSPNSSSTVKSREQDFQDILDGIKEREAVVDMEWDATEALASSSRYHGTHAKVVRLLGPLEPSPPPKGMTPSPSSLFSDDKAKVVMGYPGIEDHPTPVTSPSKSAQKLRFWSLSPK
ncbi:MAG: hypothetical protein Q9166_003743 [cf. Caloplaca sp. 2 TL-2023]